MVGTVFETHITNIVERKNFLTLTSGKGGFSSNVAWMRILPPNLATCVNYMHLRFPLESVEGERPPEGNLYFGSFELPAAGVLPPL